MDLSATIKALRQEAARLDRTIAMLDGRQEGGTLVLKSRRGRKSMGPTERKEVAERMRRYWASRRNAKG